MRKMMIIEAKKSLGNVAYNYIEKLPSKYLYGCTQNTGLLAYSTNHYPSNKHAYNLVILTQMLFVNHNCHRNYG